MNVLGLCRVFVSLSVHLPSLRTNGMPRKSASRFRFRRLLPIFSIKDDIIGMHRVDKVWDLPVRLSQPESVHLAAECAATCCSALGICDVDASIAAASCARGLASCPEYNKERRRCIASDTEYQLYTSNMFSWEE